MPHPAIHRLRLPGPRLALGLIAAAGCLVLVSRLDVGAIGGTLRAANGPLILIGLTCNLLFYVVKGWRWWLLTRAVGARLPFWPAARISSLGIFMATLYPGLGEGARLVLLTRRAVPATAATAAVLEERLVDTAALGILLVSGLWLAPTALPYPMLGLDGPLLLGGGGAVLVGLALVLLLARRRSASTRRAAWRGRLGALIARFLATLRASGAEVARRPVLGIAIVGATVAAQVLAVATSWATVLAFGLTVSPVAVIMFVVTINLGLGLFPAPVGLGLYQVAGLTLLGSAAVSPEIAVAAATGIQIVNYGAATLAALAAVVPELRPLATHHEHPARTSVLALDDEQSLAMRPTPASPRGQQ